MNQIGQTVPIFFSRIVEWTSFTFTFNIKCLLRNHGTSMRIICIKHVLLPLSNSRFCRLDCYKQSLVLPIIILTMVFSCLPCYLLLWFAPYYTYIHIYLIYTAQILTKRPKRLYKLLPNAGRNTCTNTKAKKKLNAMRKKICF